MRILVSQYIIFPGQRPGYSCAQDVNPCRCEWIQPPDFVSSPLTRGPMTTKRLIMPPSYRRRHTHDLAGKQMSIDLRSINIGRRKTIKLGNNVVETGIDKTPSFERMNIDPLGFRQDVVVDTKGHGGPPDQAVY